MVRIGNGYDVHRLVKGRRLVLGGVDISHDKGLDGHSDADVLVHAMMDALLGAAALGDIEYATACPCRTAITRSGLPDWKHRLDCRGAAAKAGVLY